MKKNCVLAAVFVMCFVLSAQAQSTRPPVVTKRILPSGVVNVTISGPRLRTVEDVNVTVGNVTVNEGSYEAAMRVGDSAARLAGELADLRLETARARWAAERAEKSAEAAAKEAAEKKCCPPHYCPAPAPCDCVVTLCAKDWRCIPSYSRVGFTAYYAGRNRTWVMTTRRSGSGASTLNGRIRMAGSTYYFDASDGKTYRAI